jgi:hypothetical protein
LIILVGGVNVEQGQQTCLQWLWLWTSPWLAVGGGDEAEPGEGLEDQPPGGFGGPADVQSVEGDRWCDGRSDLGVVVGFT